MDIIEKKVVKEHTITITPRYNETDQGGVVHHSVYPVYFEMGRTELLRLNNSAYKDLEAAGIHFVISELDIRYRRPVMYDEQLLLKTICADVSAVKIEHKYELTRNGELVAQGRSVLVCVNSEGKVRRIPKQLCAAIG